jgi:hypothetical protein
VIGYKLEVYIASDGIFATAASARDSLETGFSMSRSRISLEKSLDSITVYSLCFRPKGTETMTFQWTIAAETASCPIHHFFLLRAKTTKGVFVTLAKGFKKQC